MKPSSAGAALVLAVVAAIWAANPVRLPDPRWVAHAPDWREVPQAAIEAMRGREGWRYLPERFAESVRRHPEFAVRARALAWIESGDGALHVTRDWRNPDVESAVLGSVATAQDDAFLLGLAKDDRLVNDVRDRAIRVLARPGAVRAVPDLTDLALRADVPSLVRRNALAAIGRIGTAPDPRLLAMLDMPRDDLDLAAACVLGALGPGVEAPSLIDRLLVTAGGCTPRRWVSFEPYEFAVVAAERLAGSDADVAAAIADVRARALVGGMPRTGEDAVRRLGAAFHAWFERHPECLDTAWERQRAADAASPERARRLALRNVEDILAADDASIDVALAYESLCPHGNPQDLAEILDRTARRLRPLVDAADGPRARLAVLQRELVPRTHLRLWDVDPNSAHSAVRLASAHCVGWTLTMLSIGDRLGLPLRPALAPLHVYVRWDDGDVRMNFDPMYRGASLTDDEVAAVFGMPPDAAARAAWHAPVSRRELLAVAISNPIEDAEPRPFELHDAANRLAPENWFVAMRLAAAVARESRDPGRALRLLESAERDPRFQPEWITLLADGLLDGSEPLRALELAPRIPGASERDRVTLRALTLLGRAAEAEHVARAVTDSIDAPESLVAAATEAIAATRGDTEGARALVGWVRRGGDSSARAGMTARALLERRPTTRTAARRVLALVEALEPDGNGEGADVTPPAAPDESLEDLMARISRVRFRRDLWLQARDAARRAAEDPDLPE